MPWYIKTSPLDLTKKSKYGFTNNAKLCEDSNYKYYTYSFNASDYAYIGLTPVAVSDSTEAAESTRIPDGIYVVEVVNGDPAYEAGILPGDIITKINDTELHTVAEYSLLLESLHPGDEVPVEVRREARGEYRKLDYTLTVGKR
mgnify:CR=1 FL=1